MIDPIGFTASVLTLIQGAKFVQQTLSDIKTGGRDRERLVAEVRSLQSVLERLKNAGDQATTNHRQDAWIDLVGHLSSGHGGVLTLIDDVISEIRVKIERRSGLKGVAQRWIWAFEKEDVERNIRQIQRLSQNVSLVLQEVAIKATWAVQESVSHLNKITDRREIRSIWEWLSALNFFDQQQLEYSKVVSRTCDWFLTSPKYVSWKNREQQTLYCSAIGGAGKTVLASVAVDDLRMQNAGQDVAILVLFCKHDRPETRSVEKLGMTLLRQIVQLRSGSDRPISQKLEELLQKHYYSNDTRPGIEQIVEVINNDLSLFSRTFIVVDGLDEVMEDGAREKILTFLLSLKTTPQFLFTSRPLSSIQQVFTERLSTTDVGLANSQQTILEEDDGFLSSPAETDDEESSNPEWEEGEEEVEEEEEDGSDWGSANSEDSNSRDINELTVPPSSAKPSQTSAIPNISNAQGMKQPDHNQLVAACFACGTAVTSIYFQCKLCPDLALCAKCYATGKRCISGDSKHDEAVMMRIPCFKMDVSARPRAIKTYVRSRVQQSPVLLRFTKEKPEFASEIEEVVTSAAQRMFLLAQLHMDAMSHPDLLKFSEVRRALENLPTQLFDSYDNAMNRIQDHGRSLLRLIACAKRPLTTAEVEHALSLSPGMTELSQDEIIPAATLISRCAGLVTLDENYDVVYSHYTIAGYFGEHRDRLFGNSEEIMAEGCLTYLMLDEFQNGAVHGQDEGIQFDYRLKEYPFYDYASIFWGIHARDSKARGILDTACGFVRNEQCRNASIQALWYSSDEETANWRSRNEASALQLAMFFGYQELAIVLLDNMPDIRVQDVFGTSPLMWAVQAGDFEMTKKLISMEAPLNSVNNDGEGVLYLAIENGHDDIAQFLVDQSGLDVNRTMDHSWSGTRGVTPLMAAVRNERVPVIRSLLKRDDLLINAADSRGITALHRACSIAGEVTKALTSDTRLNLEPMDHSGNIPLTNAASSGNLIAVCSLLDAGANVNARESHLNGNGTALMRAADYDYPRIVSELIRRNIDYNALDCLGRNAVHSAAINGSDEALDALLELPDIDINLQDINGITPLHDAAVYRGDCAALESLLKKGARFDLMNKRGKTALDLARSQKLAENVLILKKAYARSHNIPLRSLTGGSLEELGLLEASRQGDESAIDSILEGLKYDKTINLEEVDDWLGQTPLHHACAEGHFSIVKKLHRAGAKINVSDKYGRTPLHTAALHQYSKIARYLLRNGADPATVDKWGTSVMEDAKPFLQVGLLHHGLDVNQIKNIQHPLYYAAQMGNLDVVKRLIAAGANPQEKDSEGRSPYERARRANRTEVAKYLDEAGKLSSESASTISGLTPTFTSTDTLSLLTVDSNSGPDGNFPDDIVDSRASEKGNQVDTDPITPRWPREYTGFILMLIISLVLTAYYVVKLRPQRNPEL